MPATLPEPTLIHIGLPKTATTWLQARWAADPRVCLLRGGLAELIDRARREGRRERPPAGVPGAPGFRWDDGPPAPGQHLVVSNEALSNAYLNEGANARRFDCFRQHAAALMKALAPRARILIVTRAPEDWIHSIHNQSIKQGGTARLERFLRHERDYLESSLDLRELYLCWRRHYGSDRVRMLPMELLRDDPDAFFAEIEHFCGLPPSPPAGPEHGNRSLSPGRLELLRRFNGWTRLLAGAPDEDRPMPIELARAIETVRHAVRDRLQAPDPELRRRLRRIERRCAGRRTDRAPLPRDLIAPIRKRLGKHFRKDDFFGYRDLYVRGGA